MGYELSVSDLRAIQGATTPRRSGESVNSQRVRLPRGRAPDRGSEFDGLRRHPTPGNHGDGTLHARLPGPRLRTPQLRRLIVKTSPSRRSLNNRYPTGCHPPRRLLNNRRIHLVIGSVNTPRGGAFRRLLCQIPDGDRRPAASRTVPPTLAPDTRIPIKVPPGGVPRARRACGFDQ